MPNMARFQLGQQLYSLLTMGRPIARLCGLPKNTASNLGACMPDWKMLCYCWGTEAAVVTASDTALAVPIANFWVCSPRLAPTSDLNLQTPLLAVVHCECSNWIFSFAASQLIAHSSN